MRKKYLYIVITVPEVLKIDFRVAANNFYDTYLFVSLSLIC